MPSKPNLTIATPNLGANTASRGSVGKSITFKTLMPVATLALALAASSAAVAQDLYLIIGQSNAAGRDTNIRPNNVDAPDNNVMLLNGNDEFEVATQPLNQYSTVMNNQPQGVSFGLEFGIDMHDDNGRTVYLVSNARGGTRVAEWRDGRGLFGPAVARVRQAESECNCDLTGILWHQGESNAGNGTFTSSYFTTLQNIIAEFRGEFGNVPFIVGEIDRSSDNLAFNRAIRTVDDRAFETDDVEWARSAGLDTFDGTHFDSSSMRRFGSRYANRMQQFVD